MANPVHFRRPASLSDGAPVVRCATIRLHSGPAFHDSVQCCFCLPSTDDEAADQRALREGLAKSVAESIINDKWEN